MELLDASDVVASGTMIARSAMSRILPPPFPSSATVRTPISLACSMARIALGESPLVDMQTRTSPSLPWASTERAKTSS